MPWPSAVRFNSSPEQGLAVRDDAHLLGPFDAPVPWQHGSGQGDRHALTGRDVGRTTDVDSGSPEPRLTVVSEGLSARG